MSSLLNSITGHHNNKHTSASSASMSSSNASSSSSSSHHTGAHGSTAATAAADVLHAATGHHNQHAANAAYSNSSQYSNAGASSASGAGYGSASNSSYSSASSASTAAAAAGFASTDDAMTRSEERLHVGKQTVQAGTAGLHKYVTSEHVSTAVPLTKERVVVEREPITAANIDKAMAGPELKEAEYAVAVNEEVAVANKETVPIERIRMKKVADQTQEYVEADLRKEHIDVIDNTGTLQADKTLGAAPTQQQTTQQTRAQRT